MTFSEPATVDARQGIETRVYGPADYQSRLLDWESCEAPEPTGPLSHHPRWLDVLRQGLSHEPYAVEALKDGRVVGWLPLALVRSLCFGRFLVSLPYLNSAGVRTADSAAAEVLIDRAVELAERLDVRYLELRHEREVVHPALTHTSTVKAHLRLPLPERADDLWKAFDPKVRNQIRKGEKQGFEVAWGGETLLGEFYAVFSRNMRDLGTPVYGRRLFASILRAFPGDAEFCAVRLHGRPVAAALLLHGRGVTEVPSASSLRDYHVTNANMFMYWQLLRRAIERRQPLFDFGRSSQGSGTYRFKTQWGAQPFPAVWQYHVRRGQVGEMRPDSPKYRRAIRVWQRLPVAVANRLGPWIVRGIP
jgi:serine/alanine adding enzyme